MISNYIQLHNAVQLFIYIRSIFDFSFTNKQTYFFLLHFQICKKGDIILYTWMLTLILGKTF